MLNSLNSDTKQKKKMLNKLNTTYISVVSFQLETEYKSVHVIHESRWSFHKTT